VPRALVPTTLKSASRSPSKSPGAARSVPVIPFIGYERSGAPNPFDDVSMTIAPERRTAMSAR